MNKHPFYSHSLWNTQQRSEGAGPFITGDFQTEQWLSSVVQSGPRLRSTQGRSGLSLRVFMLILFPVSDLFRKWLTAGSGLIEGGVCEVRRGGAQEAKAIMEAGWKAPPLHSASKGLSGQLPVRPHNKDAHESQLEMKNTILVFCIYKKAAGRGVDEGLQSDEWMNENEGVTHIWFHLVI